MALEDAAVVAIVGIMVIEGLWLAVLTYLMWRARQQKPAAETPTGST